MTGELFQPLPAQDTAEEISCTQTVLPTCPLLLARGKMANLCNFRGTLLT